MMERALKERIIGAAVLVVFVVLVVPVFLDGPPEQGGVVTERVLLPGQDDQKTQTVVLERDRTEPVPVANSTQPEAAPAAEHPAGTRVRGEAGR
jgi:DedD protein